MAVLKSKFEAPKRKPIGTIIKHALYGSIFVFALTLFFELPLKHQISNVLLYFAFSIIFNYFPNKHNEPAAEIIEGKLLFLDFSIDLSCIESAFYWEEKQLEHVLKINYTNETYQEFWLTDADLIDDLRFYHFLVENQLSVRLIGGELI